MLHHEEEKVRSDFEKEVRALLRLKRIPQNARRRADRKARCLEMLETHACLPGVYTTTLEAVTATRDADLIAHLKPHQVTLPIEGLWALTDDEFIEMVGLGLQLFMPGPKPARAQINHLSDRYALNPTPQLRQAILDWQRPGGPLTTGWWMSHIGGIANADARDLACEILRRHMTRLHEEPIHVRSQFLRNVGAASEIGLPIALIAGLQIGVETALASSEDLPPSLAKIFASRHAYLDFLNEFRSLDETLTPEVIARLRDYIAG